MPRWAATVGYGALIALSATVLPIVLFVVQEKTRAFPPWVPLVAGPIAGWGALVATRFHRSDRWASGALVGLGAVALFWAACVGLGLWVIEDTRRKCAPYPDSMCGEFAILPLAFAVIGAAVHVPLVAAVVALARAPAFLVRAESA